MVLALGETVDEIRQAVSKAVRLSCFCFMGTSVSTRLWRFCIERRLIRASICLERNNGKHPLVLAAGKFTDALNDLRLGKQ